MPPPVLKDGEVVSSRYRVAGNKPIGAGQFAEVFRALDQTSDQRSPTFVAIKIAREEKTTSREVRALQDLQGCPGVCRLLGQGSHKNQHPFIVMQLGGENLAEIRHTRVAERRRSRSGAASKAELLQERRLCVLGLRTQKKRLVRRVAELLEDADLQVASA